MLQISSGNISDNGQRFTNHSGMQKLAWHLEEWNDGIVVLLDRPEAEGRKSRISLTEVRVRELQDI